MNTVTGTMSLPIQTQGGRGEPGRCLGAGMDSTLAPAFRRQRIPEDGRRAFGSAMDTGEKIEHDDAGRMPRG